MTVYATLSDTFTALEIYDRLLRQNVGLERVSVVSGKSGQTARLDSLHIPQFGTVWGLGNLSQASVAAAALSVSGQVQLDAVLPGLPDWLTEQLRSRYQGGEALMEVDISSPLEQLILSAMLSAYGARVFEHPN